MARPNARPVRWLRSQHHHGLMLSHVGKYEVKQLLGKGATGSVYLAIDPFGQREVETKFLERLSIDPEEARKQLRFFQNEAALAGKLRHPHIVSILDAGIEDVSAGDPLRYLVMEVVDGPPLTKHCEPSALLDPMVSVEIAYKCCKALEFANTLGVVHRDIKPANILTRGEESGEHTTQIPAHRDLLCPLLLVKKKKRVTTTRASRGAPEATPLNSQPP